jgi:hypothetical protein
MYAQMEGPLSEQQKADNDVALASFGPVISGLILESHFEPANPFRKRPPSVAGRDLRFAVSNSSLMVRKRRTSLVAWFRL